VMKQRRGTKNSISRDKTDPATLADGTPTTWGKIVGMYFLAKSCMACAEGHHALACDCMVVAKRCFDDAADPPYDDMDRIIADFHLIRKGREDEQAT